MATQHIILSFSQGELERIISDCIKSELQKFIIPTSIPKTEFISRKMAKSILGISLVTLGDYCKRGIIPSYRIGSRVLFKEHEIIESVSKVKTYKYKKGEID